MNQIRLCLRYTQVSIWIFLYLFAHWILTFAIKMRVNTYIFSLFKFLNDFMLVAATNLFSSLFVSTLCVEMYPASGYSNPIPTHTLYITQTYNVHCTMRVKGVNVISFFDKIEIFVRFLYFMPNDIAPHSTPFSSYRVADEFTRLNFWHHTV